MRQWGSFLAIVLWMSIVGECATQTVATWVDDTSRYPYYSVYNGTSWTTPAEISSTQLSYGGGTVYTAYNSANQTTMATWSSDSIGYYSIYQNGSWSSAAEIPNSSPYSDVFVTFDAYTGQFMTSWQNSLNQYAYVAFYTNGSWSSPVDVSAGFLVINNVYAAFDSSGNAIATWTDVGTNQAIYAIYYNGNWIGAGEITTPDGDIENDVFVSYNPTLGFVATWAAGNGMHLYGAYAPISAGSINWSSSRFATLPGGDLVAATMGSSYNPILHETLVAYVVSGTSSFLNYTTLNSSGTWSSDLSTTSPTLDYSSAYTTYDANSEATLAVFLYASVFPGYPYYATYSGSSWTSNPITTSFSIANGVYAGPFPSSLNPPTHLQGSRRVNNFGTLREYYDTLTWSASTSTDVVSYVIYANGVKAATVSSSTLSYQTHNQRKTKSIVYQVLALDSSGNLSSSATVTVN